MEEAGVYYVVENGLATAPPALANDATPAQHAAHASQRARVAADNAANLKARGIILRYVSDHHARAVAAVPTAQEARDQLSAEFVQVSIARQSQLQMQLSQLRMQADETVAGFFARTMLLRDELTSAGCPPSDHSLMLAVLNAMPPEFKIATQLLRPPSSQQQGRSSRPVCQYCNYPGHVLSECRRFARDHGSFARPASPSLAQAQFSPSQPRGNSPSRGRGDGAGGSSADPAGNGRQQQPDAEQANVLFMVRTNQFPKLSRTEPVATPLPGHLVPENMSDEEFLDFYARMPRWVIDSGANRHIMPWRSCLSDYHAFDPPIQLQLGGQGSSIDVLGVASALWTCLFLCPYSHAALGALARHMAAPTQQHWTAAKAVLSYLKGTASQGLVFGGNDNLQGYCDADYAGDKDTARSTTGYVFTLHGAAISWSSRLQPTVAMSTAEAEYMAASGAVKEAVWLRKLMQDLGLPGTCVNLMCDNQAALQLLNNPMASARSKHISVHHHFARERAARGEVMFTYCSTSEMVADVMTKPLAAVKLGYAKEGCGISSIGLKAQMKKAQGETMQLRAEVERLHQQLDDAMADFQQVQADMEQLQAAHQEVQGENESLEQLAEERTYAIATQGPTASPDLRHMYQLALAAIATQGQAAPAQVLDKDNYAIWAIRLRGMMEEAGVYYVVENGLATAPPALANDATPAQHAAHASQRARVAADNAANLKARGIILRYVSDHHARAVAAVPTAQEAWDQLSAEFVQVSIARQSQLQMQLSQLRMQADETVAGFFARTMLLRDELTSAGCPPSDHSLMLAVLNAMPPEFKIATQLLRPPSSQQQGRSSRPVCQYCNYPGHVLSECRRFARDHGSFARPASPSLAQAQFSPSQPRGNSPSRGRGDGAGGSSADPAGNGRQQQPDAEQANVLFMVRTNQFPKLSRTEPVATPLPGHLVPENMSDEEFLDFYARMPRWVIDSGANRHIMPWRSCLSDYHAFDPPIQLQLGGQGSSIDVLGVASALWTCLFLCPYSHAALGALARHMAAPTQQHWTAAKAVLSYLKGTASQGLVFGGNDNLQGYCDADYAGDKDTARSTTGYVFTLHGAAISWSSRLQPTVAMSTAEAEYMAASGAVKEAVWLRKLMQDLGLPGTCVNLMCDNQAALQLLNNPMASARSKHISVHHHFARERAARGEVMFTYCSTSEMVADVMTKPLAAVKLGYAKEGCGISSM
ncbi:hypothetical protein QJQ45_025973 [Haematococcus lacustris]|nr:hypothetical protein QJQ45_025973 [Haematococcus lacustris]